MPMISIIVPVYNVERYLKRCLDSILHQTYSDWECILIDDGSPDDSGAICDEYALQDKRFRVIHKKNGGVSSARNMGLDAACGEWITFVDADDFIGITFIASLINPVLEHEDIDFVHAGCVNWSNGKVVGVNQQYKYLVGCDHGKVFRDFRGLAVSKLFRLDHINRGTDGSPVRFDERMRIAEDMAFTLDYLLMVKKYAFVPETGYYYRKDNEQSATSIKSKSDYEMEFHSFRHLYNSSQTYIKRYNLSETDCLLRYSQLSEKLFSVCLSLVYCHTYNKAQILEKLKTDFSSSEYALLRYRNFGIVKNVCAALLIHKCFKSYVFIIRMIDKIKY